MGKRMVWGSESKDGADLDTAQVKHITGGGKLTARPLYGNPVSFTPTHLAILMTNRRPHAPADDDAAWERIQLIPFDVRFVDDPNAPDERKRDPKLKEKLAAEGPGVLAMLVRGTMAWLKDGLNPPERVKLATREYREAEDTITQFIDDCCHVEDGVEEGARELYERYQSWAEEVGLPKLLSGKQFGEGISAGFAKGHKNTGNYYQGVRLNFTKGLTK